jgi:hypothetical protein
METATHSRALLNISFRVPSKVPSLKVPLIESPWREMPRS